MLPLRVSHSTEARVFTLADSSLAPSRARVVLSMNEWPFEESLERLVVIIYHRCVCVLGTRAACVDCRAVRVFPFL